MSIGTKIRDFILENYLYTNDGSELSNDQSLLEAGIIDSTGVMEVIAFIQKTFGIQVEDEEMIPDNLDTVESIVAYIGRKSSKGL